MAMPSLIIGVNGNDKTYHAGRRCERSEAIQPIKKGF
jgi:hypothetical protein